MNSTTNYLNNFIKFRSWFVTVSNVLGILFCFYMITQAAKYEISWNLFSSIFPGTTSKINYLLQVTGTYILIIPITIIILALLYPENLKLKIIGSFFGLSSTLAMLVSGFLRSAGTDIYNMKIFLVTKLLSLEEKQIIFKESFKRVLAEKYKMTGDAISKHQGLLSEEYFITYNTRLNELKDPVAIYNYASEIIKNNLILTNEATSNFNYVYVKYAILGAVTLIVVVGGFVLLRGFWVDAAKQSAELAKDNAELSAQSNDHVTMFMEQVQSLVSTIANEVLSVSIESAHIVNTSTNQAFANLTELARHFYKQFQGVQNALDVTTETVLKHEDRINALEKTIETLVNKTNA